MIYLLSSLDRRAIVSQKINANGQLVTVVNRSTFFDGTEQHPAGTLVSDPVTDNRGLDDESIYSMSCTRTIDGIKIVVWDEGKFYAL